MGSQRPPPRCIERKGPNHRHRVCSLCRCLGAVDTAHPSPTRRALMSTSRSRQTTKTRKTSKVMKTINEDTGRTERQRSIEMKTLVVSDESESPTALLTQDNCPLDKSLKRHALHSQQKAKSGACCQQLSHFGIVCTICGVIKRPLIRGHSWAPWRPPPPRAPPLQVPSHVSASPGLKREQCHESAAGYGADQSPTFL